MRKICISLYFCTYYYSSCYRESNKTFQTLHTGAKYEFFRKVRILKNLHFLKFLGKNERKFGTLENLKNLPQCAVVISFALKFLRKCESCQSGNLFYERDLPKPTRTGADPERFSPFIEHLCK